MAILAHRAQMTKGGHSPARRALPALAIAGVVGLALLVSACGSSSGARVAQLGTTSSGTGSGSSSGSGSGGARAYAACMRRHGVRNFPDPDSKGRLLITGGVDSSGQMGVDMNSRQARAAAEACRKLLPNGGRPTAAQQAKAQQAMLKFAQCMRAHGVPKFPDPKPGGGLVLGKKAGVDPNTPEFKTAQQSCRNDVPDAPIAAQPGPTR